MEPSRYVSETRTWLNLFIFAADIISIPAYTTLSKIENVVRRPMFNVSYSVTWQLTRHRLAA